jgi:hypothetical protein
MPLFSLLGRGGFINLLLQALHNLNKRSLLSESVADFEPSRPIDHT